MSSLASELARERQKLALTHKAQKLDLDKKHKQEKKQVKNTGTKAELKALNKKIAASEQRLKSNQKNEVDELISKYPSLKDNTTSSDEFLQNLQINATTDSKIEDQEPTTNSEFNPTQRRVSKAEKIRQKKRLEELELEKRVENAKLEDLKNLGQSKKFLEQKYISIWLKDNNRKSINIKSDGNCLFEAILQSQTLPDSKWSKLKIDDRMVNDINPSIAETTTNNFQTTKTLRLTIADFLINNQHEYKHYIPRNFEKYIAGLRSGDSWGGETELSVISKLLRIKITVVQWNGNYGVNKTEYKTFDESDCEDGLVNKATVLYYKFMMGSAHYNGSFCC